MRCLVSWQDWLSKQWLSHALTFSWRACTSNWFRSLSYVLPAQDIILISFSFVTVWCPRLRARGATRMTARHLCGKQSTQVQVLCYFCQNLSCTGGILRHHVVISHEHNRIFKRKSFLAQCTVIWQFVDVNVFTDMYFGAGYFILSFPSEPIHKENKGQVYGLS